jgi:ubiquinone/menaquinone biosynthesis C-methylase UbiE
VKKEKTWGKERAELFAKPIKKMASPVYAALARRSTADLTPDEGNPMILDLGSGPGFLMVEIKRLFPQAHVIGVDPSEPMLKIARDNADAAGFKDIETMLGRAEKIPVDSKTISLLISQWSLHDWDDPEKSFSEIARVLKPSGVVVISDWDRAYPRWRFYRHNLDLMRRAGWKKAREARNSYRHSYTFEDVLGLLRQFHFEAVEVDGDKPIFFVKAIKRQ